MRYLFHYTYLMYTIPTNVIRAGSIKKYGKDESYAQSWFSAIYGFDSKTRNPWKRLVLDFYRILWHVKISSGMFQVLWNPFTFLLNCSKWNSVTRKVTIVTVWIQFFNKRKLSLIALSVLWNSWIQKNKTCSLSLALTTQLINCSAN